MASPRAAWSSTTPDNPRSKSAKALAHLYKLRDQESGGYVGGQSLVFLLLVTPKISIPVGFVFYQPDPKLSAWYQKEKALKSTRSGCENLSLAITSLHGVRYRHGNTGCLTL
jgi:hypothetical protein